MFEVLLLFLIVLLGFFVGPWYSWKIIRKTREKIRLIKRCTDTIEAEILSWSCDYDPESGTSCTPKIRYTYLDEVHEVEFNEIPINRRTKEREYTGSTMKIGIDPENAANITANDRKRAVSHQLHFCIGWCALCLFFLLLAIFLILF